MTEEARAAPLVVLANRGPQRRRQGRWVRSSGGLVTALDPVLRERGGVWVSAADHEADDPPDAGYRQALVRLSPETRAGFYSAVSNGVLWPALHGFPTIARMTDAPWGAYATANAAFAEHAAAIADDAELVWVHDYHLMLAPALLRERRPGLRIGWFCHVPWPDAGHFAILPWRREILTGLLGADVVGFHTTDYAAHALDCFERLADARVDRERSRVETARGWTRVIAAPIGIPTTMIADRVHSEDVRARERAVRKAVGDRRIILGVDRLDYTKGIPERLAGFARLLQRRPDLRDEIVLVQIVVPSRQGVRAYARLKEEIDRLVGELNGRFGRTGQVAVHYVYHGLGPTDLFAHYRAADVALVTPLRDGMNLVALEYVASRKHEDGALVLSEFAGAAERLDRAFIVNPYDADAVAEQLDRALHAPPEELRSRMRVLRAAVAELDVHAWAAAFLRELERPPARPGSGAPHGSAESGRATPPLPHPPGLSVNPPPAGLTAEIRNPVA